MTGTELWEQFQRYTRDATEFSRKVAFAGTAICWFFKTDAASFPPMILWSLLSLVGFFLADLLQSFVAALVYRAWLHKEEAKRFSETGSIDGHYEKPRWLDYPAFTLFCIKYLSLLLAYWFIARELWMRQQ